MSAWMHGNYHLSAVVNSIYRDVRLIPETAPKSAKEAFEMLREANARSIEARYRHHGSTAADYVEQCGEYLPHTDTLDHESLKMALGSIRYQSCEFAEWDTCEAALFIVAVRGVLARLTGSDDYDELLVRSDSWCIEGSVRPGYQSDHDGRMTYEDMVSELVCESVSDLAELAVKDYDEFAAQISPVLMSQLLDTYGQDALDELVEHYTRRLGVRPAGW